MSASSDCLIGYSGFVGGILREKHEFGDLYNSKNYTEMRGRTYKNLVCCGVSAVKWQANKDPDADWQKIDALASVLETTSAVRAIIISTVDVYPDPTNADEKTDCHGKENHAYGKNRLAFEDRMRAHFPKCYILRLPGLFGPGLRKNVIYDLIHDNMLHAINPMSCFQWYDVSRLWTDIIRTVSNEVELINLTAEPVRTGDVVSSLFPDKTVGQATMPAPNYDVRTLHANVFEEEGPYILKRWEVLERLSRYVDGQRKMLKGEV